MNRKGSKANKAGEFRAILRSRGYKATTPRLKVLAFLQLSKKPITAQEVAEKLKNEMNQATVYRTMKKLKTCGVVKQIDLRHNHAHYELSDKNDHHHIVCVRCGRVEDVEGCDVEETYRSILRRAKHFSSIKEHSLEFYGICKTCELSDTPVKNNDVR